MDKSYCKQGMSYHKFNKKLGLVLYLSQPFQNLGSHSDYLIIVYLSNFGHIF